MFKVIVTCVELDEIETENGLELNEGNFEILVDQEINTLFNLKSFIFDMKRICKEEGSTYFLEKFKRSEIDNDTFNCLINIYIPSENFIADISHREKIEAYVSTLIGDKIPDLSTLSNSNSQEFFCSREFF